MKDRVHTYREYTVGDFFRMQRGHTLTVNDKEIFKGDIPCINASTENNGIVCKLSPDVETIGFKLIKAPALSLGRVGSSVTFLQTEDFYVADNAYALIPKQFFSNEVLLYFSTILNCNQKLYSYGRTVKNSYIDTIIKLPVFNNEPDWQYMEEFIKSLHHKPIKTKIKKNATLNLNVAEWKPFRVGKILKIINGKGITQKEISENSGDFDAVQSGEENNGVIGKINLEYCKKKKYSYTLNPCLTVARSGTAGFVSYHGKGCVVGDSAKILLLKKDNPQPEHYLFLLTILSALRFKYTYGRKVTEEGYLNEMIALPVKKMTDETRMYSDEGFMPDWDFMKKYINTLPYSDRLK